MAGQINLERNRKVGGREEKNCRINLIQHFQNVLNEDRNKERKNICGKMQRRKAGMERRILHQEKLTRIFPGLQKSRNVRENKIKSEDITIKMSI